MPALIKRFIKKILKTVVRVAARVAVWTILFINFILLHSKKNHIHAILASLCFGNSLVFKINPKLLKYHILDPDIMPENLFVWSGEWDRDIILIEEHEKINMINELFVEKKDFRNTQFYSIAVNKMNEGKPLQRGNNILDSRENIRRYFKKNIELFNGIKNNGFKLNLAPEVGIVVGRDGRIIHFRQGHHTLAIAKILGVDNVIVRIRAVHSLWLQDKIKSKSSLRLLNSVCTSFSELFE
jgi:hypothetical protein